VPESVLFGMNLGYKRMELQAGLSVVGGVLTAAAAYAGLGLAGVSGAQLAIAAITGLCYWGIARAYVSWFGAERPTRSDIRALFAMSGWLSLGDLIAKLLLASDLVPVERRRRGRRRRRPDVGRDGRADALVGATRTVPRHPRGPRRPDPPLPAAGARLPAGGRARAAQVDRAAAGRDGAGVCRGDGARQPHRGARVGGVGGGRGAEPGARRRHRVRGRTGARRAPRRDRTGARDRGSTPVTKPVLRYRETAGLPRLAWLATTSREDGDVLVYYG